MKLIFNLIFIAFMITLLILLFAIIRYLNKNVPKKSHIESIDERKERISIMFENIFLISVFSILIFGIIFVLSIPLYDEVIHIYPQKSNENLLICY